MFFTTPLLKVKINICNDHFKEWHCDASSMKEVKSKSTNNVILSLYISKYSKESRLQLAHSPSWIFGPGYTYKYIEWVPSWGESVQKHTLPCPCRSWFPTAPSVHVAQGNQCLNSGTQVWSLKLGGMNMPTSNSLFIFPQKFAEILKFCLELYWFNVICWRTCLFFTGFYFSCITFSYFLWIFPQDYTSPLLYNKEPCLI